MRKRIQLALAGAGAVAALAYGICNIYTHWPVRFATSDPSADRRSSAVLRHADGVDLPTIRSLADAHLDSDEEVVGLLVNGRARAYRLEAMAYLRNHVLNDVIDGRPVTVTYCDLTDCVLVLTADGRAEPLDIDIGGNSAGLFLFVDGEAYDQKTGLSAQGQEPLPLDKLPYERTTWEEWRLEHPKTDVYVGQ